MTHTPQEAGVCLPTVRAGVKTKPFSLVTEVSVPCAGNLSECVRVCVCVCVCVRTRTLSRTCISFQVCNLFKLIYFMFLESFPCSSVVKESACNAGDLGSIPGSGRFTGEGHGNPLQYPCLENLMDREAWWSAVHGVAKSWPRLIN